MSAEKQVEITIRIAENLYMYEFRAEESLSADIFQKRLNFKKRFFVQQQINFMDDVNNKNQDFTLPKSCKAFIQ